MKRYLIVICCLIALGSPATMQAQIQAKYEMARDFYQRLAYSKAIPLFEEYLAKKNDNLDAKIMLADCYRKNNQYIPAEHWYGEVAKDKALADPVQILYYAQILQVREKYSEAAQWYDNYLARVPGDKRASLQRDACLNIQSLQSTKDSYIITNMPFNTDGYDFGTCLVKDRFLFTSTGGKNTGEKTNLWTGEGFMDIYEVMVLDSGRQYSGASKWQPTINTKYNEGTVWFDNARGKVYFTRNDYNPDEKQKMTYSSAKESNLMIYEASNNGSAWTDVKELPFNNKEFSCGHPTVSADGLTMYFASTMPGGKGGVDIWRSVLVNDTWQAPVNLGDAVNTEGDEMFPYLFQDNRLYFASDGHGGLGGLDIFLYELGKPAAAATNIGAPFNSAYDDFGFVSSEDTYYGYFTSDRPGGKGEDDIYRYVNNEFVLEVLVVDKLTQAPIEKANVDVLLDEESIASLVTPTDGIVSAKVLGGNTYRILADAYQYLPDSATRLIEQDENQRVQRVKIELMPITLEVQVIDAETKEPIGNALVAIKSKCLDEPKALTTDAAGNTEAIRAMNDCDYNLQANAKGYKPKVKDVQLRNVNAPYKVVIELEPIDDQAIVLNNIYYDFDKWNIRSDAEEDLNMLLQFLKSNPDAVIELSSHTDARASDDYNLALSQKRAQSAVNWLIARGISSKRMKAVGYGETKPVNGCVNDVQCPEADHQQNRRTEFRVLNAGEVTSSKAKKDIKVDPCKGCKF